MIERGEQWGVPTTCTPSDVMVTGDYELSLSTTDSRLIVCGGDIAHSLGDPQPPIVGDNCTEVPIDALRVLITLRNGTTHSYIAASHVMIGEWLRGRLVCVSNSGFIGTRNVSPRAHPNDGLFDVMILAPVSKIEFLKVFPKVFSGKHISHPAVTIRRCREITIEADAIAYSDGERVGPLPITAKVVPKALHTWHRNH